MGTTLRRRLLRLLPRLGLQVVDMGPGTALISRSPRKLGVENIGAGVALTGRSDRNVRIEHISPGTTLVTQLDVVRRHRHEQDKALSSYLLSSLVMHVFARYGVNVVLDVGANKGQYARFLRRAGYKGRIVSFEPVARDFDELQRRAESDSEWTVHRIALGREDGRLEMNVVPGTLSSALPPTDFGARRYERLRAAYVEEVPVRRLDGLLDRLLEGLPNPRPYLKLDTQGFDLEAFAGLGQRTDDVVGMQSEVAFLQIYEGMPRMPESLAVYEAAGFEVAGLHPVSRERRTARVLEFDCVMVRATALPGA